MEVKEKIKKQRNWLEKIAHSLPGFKGYQDREFRRDADKLIRDFTADQLRQARHDILTASGMIGKQQIWAWLSKYETLEKEIERLRGEICYAERGYSGFFDLIKIRAEQLDELYRHDSQLLAKVKQFRQKASALKENPNDGSCLDGLLTALSALDSQMQRRKETHVGVS